MKTRDLNCAKCIEDEDQWVLVREGGIKKSLKSYFDKLFEGRDTIDLSELHNQIEDKNRKFVWRIRMIEIKGIKEMEMGKAVGPNEILIEIWKCLGDVGIGWREYR